MENIESEKPPQPELNEDEKRRQIIEANEQELARRRENGELEPYDYEPTYLWYRAKNNEPVTRKDVGNQAIVITQTELETLGSFKIILADGSTAIIDPENTGYGPDDKIIIFPEELGE